MNNLYELLLKQREDFDISHLKKLKKEQFEKEKQKEQELQERRLAQAKLGQKLERDEKIPRRHRWPCECRACNKK
jgi:hypothetical protein